MYEQYPDVLTVAELAKLLRIDRSTAYNLLHKGEIPYRRIGTAYRISKQAIIRYIEGEAINQKMPTE